MTISSAIPQDGRRLRIGLLCFSAIPDDPRVRRQGDALTAAGHQVIAFGLSGARGAPTAWPIVEIDGDAVPPAPQRPLLERLMVAPWKLLMLPVPGRVKNAVRLVLARMGPPWAMRAYWHLNQRFGRMVRAAEGEKVDLWIANDWTALGVGLTLAERTATPLLYDTHELAIEEYGQRPFWRWFYRPFLLALEGRGIAAAARVSCVSEGIAAALQNTYRLSDAPTVIRNMPAFSAPALRETGSPVRVLYHGIVAPGRGLENTIVSLPAWPADFHLTIRGPASEDYLASLRALATNTGVESRVTFAPPVAMTELTRAAMAFDIGLFALPGHSMHNIHALPNKFFEYVGAGLALCVADLPEMALLVKRHSLGELMASDAPQDIAAAPNRMTPERIAEAKRASVAAALELSSDMEQKRFLAFCYEAAVTRPAAAHQAAAEGE